MEAMIVQQVVDDVRATMEELVVNDVVTNNMSPLQVTSLAGHTMTIRGFCDGQYTVDVNTGNTSGIITLTISEHLP